MIDGPTGNVETAVEINVVPSENKMGSLELSAGPTRNTETFTEVMEVPTENSAISAGSIFTFDEDFEMFDEEVEMFDEEVEMFGESISNSQTALLIELLYTIFKPKYALRINREDIIQSTLAQLRLYDTSTFRDALQVVFKGEEGIDQRGLSQEFFSVITKELYNQPMIFKQYEESRLLWFPEWDPKIKDAFWLLGILCWLALYHGFVADFHFPLALYKKLLHEQPTLDDLKELSPTLGRNLQELLNYEDDDIEEVFGLNFTVGTEMADGSIIERELIPNGRNIMVRSQNRKLFVNKYVDYVFNTSVEKHFQAFSKGFRSVIPMPVVDLFLPSELMVLLHGTTEYDWIQLEENTRYGEGYTKTDEAIVNFWQMFHDLTLEDKKHFLVFLTGCDKVPVGGMNMLKIGIREDFRDDPDSYFPTGHTCNKLLDLPSWYHYDLSRHAAEALLLSNGNDGSYLLRKSHDAPNFYALSVRGKDSVKHFQIEWSEGTIKFGFSEFYSLSEFVSHFANQPLIGSETGTLLVLKSPYPRQVEEPSIYESVRVHTAMQTGRTENDLVSKAASLGTKEGYLIKQGGRVKTWKTRWFILHRNELKYFKDKMSTEPIKTLDLTECTGVQFDYSQERINCFCLVFPERTYYMCTKTGIEADEWIKLIRWKLSQMKKATKT
ncbi:dual adapter for phosphotyrosine and 3-phosphotyrosine and 3-phosphoinositide isoform X1 [Hemitrygon akajei]|uniref:dual adapter for phosphotyrosine and 3-phosphotyrosine and 3-phosphoinositide isoform X1 n=1 Tax=Hemitrygon akajei TaxID=2704970 RepID=UPI003BFA254D